MCCYISDQYWQNPRYKVTLNDTDGEVDGEGVCTIIVSLMQKNRRVMRTYLKTAITNRAIGVDIYKVSV